MKCGCRCWRGGAEIGDRDIRRGLDQNWFDLPCGRRWCQTALLALRTHPDAATVEFAIGESNLFGSVWAHDVCSALPVWELVVRMGLEQKICCEWALSVWAWQSMEDSTQEMRTCCVFGKSSAVHEEIDDAAVRRDETRLG